jgi:hypothetical protein
VDKLNAAVEISGDRALSSLVCHRCKGVGHYAKDCGRPWVGDRLGRYQQEHGGSVVSNLTELIAPYVLLKLLVKLSFAFMIDHLS